MIALSTLSPCLSQKLIGWVLVYDSLNSRYWPYVFRKSFSTLLKSLSIPSFNLKFQSAQTPIRERKLFMSNCAMQTRASAGRNVKTPRSSPLVDILEAFRNFDSLVWVRILYCKLDFRTFSSFQTHSTFRCWSLSWKDGSFCSDRSLATFSRAFFTIVWFSFS